jgi:hypothetical protein
MKEKMRGPWKFAAEYVGENWHWLPHRIDDEYLNGLFFGVWFVGRIR